MTRSIVGWMLFAVLGGGAMPLAYAAEAGGPLAKPQATSTTATSAVPPGSAQATPAAQPAATPAPTPSAAPLSSQASAAQPVAASPLEGTSWPVKVTPDAMAAQKGEKPFDDTLSFKDRRVTMSACVKLGFAASAYSLTRAGEAWSFATRQVSKEQGMTRWAATFTGETVTGTLLWMKPDGTSLRYTFQGKKAATPGAS